MKGEAKVIKPFSSSAKLFLLGSSRRKRFLSIDDRKHSSSNTDEPAELPSRRTRGGEPSATACKFSELLLIDARLNFKLERLFKNPTRNDASRAFFKSRARGF